MEGEDENSDDERAFTKAKVWKRIIVVAAGATFNIILGFILMFSSVAIDGATQKDNLLITTKIARFEENATTNQGDGLKQEDVIKKINGRTVLSIEDLSYLLGTNQGNKVDITVLRDGKTKNLEDVVFPSTEYDSKTYLTVDFYFYGEKATVLNCLKQGSLRTISMGRIVFMSLGDMLTGKFGINEVSGPVGVTQVVSDAVTTSVDNGLAGFASLLNILCLITVNLGVFNLLPIPALDGSRILFLIIEGIRRKPVKKEAYVHAIGMSILLVLMAVLVFKDLWVWIFK